MLSAREESEVPVSIAQVNHLRSAAYEYRYCARYGADDGAGEN